MGHGFITYIKICDQLTGLWIIPKYLVIVIYNSLIHLDLEFAAIVWFFVAFTS